MTDPDPKPDAEAPDATRPWLKPALAGFALLLLAGGVGFGIGSLERSGGSGPELTPDQAFAEAREQSEQEVKREMARRGFIAGKRNGRSHGIIAGGMAAESKAVIKVRQMQASAAQAAAASAQSELAGMASGSPPPVPTPDLEE